jgi:hypothetical protein
MLVAIIVFSVMAVASGVVAWIDKSRSNAWAAGLFSVAAISLIIYASI